MEEGPLLDSALTLEERGADGGGILGITTALKLPLAGGLVAEDGIDMVSSMPSESGISNWASLEAPLRVLEVEVASGVANREAGFSQYLCLRWITRVLQCTYI